MNPDVKKEFFDNVYTELNNDKCINKFYEYLDNIDVDSNFDFQLNRPINDLYMEMRQVDIPVVIRWLYDKFKDIESEFPIELKGNQLEADYNEYVKKHYDNNNLTGIASIGLNLRKYFCINREWCYGISKKKTNTVMLYMINPDILVKHIETFYLNN